MSTLIVGDHYIPASAYVEALRAHAPDAPTPETFELKGSKEDQHSLQLAMELNGVNSLDHDAELVAAMRRSEFVMLHFAPMPSEVFESGSNVRAVFVARAGTENIDVAAASANGTAVINVAGRNATGVAELSLGLMLSEGRNITRADHSVKTGGWRTDFDGPGREVGGRTVGLVGLGHVGTALAHRLAGFECRILVYDPFIDHTVIESLGAEQVELATVFRESDYISVQARLTQDTYRFIDATLIDTMKPGAYLINVGRSGLVDYDALLDALQTRRIAGAGLDVHEDNPLPEDSPWRDLDNITITTHFGGDTVETNERSARLVAEALHEVLETGVHPNAVNAGAIGWAP